MALIVDGATPMLKELMMVSRGYAMDALNYASVKLQTAMKRRARLYGSSKFGVKFDSDGNRTIVGSNQRGIKGRYYSRFSHKNGEVQHGLDEFIKFQASSVSLKSMIGFINFKTFYAEEYRNGKLTKKIRVKGQGRNPKQNGSESIKEIGEKMENGGRQYLSKKQKNLMYRSGFFNAYHRGYIDRKARPVVNPAFMEMKGEIQGMVQNKFGDALAKHAAKMSDVRKIG